MTETLDTAVRIACGVSIPLAVSLVAVPKLVKRYSLAPRTTLALWITSVAMTISAVFGIIGAPLPISSPLGVVSFAVFNFFGGMAAGALVVLILSGALSKKRGDVVA